jgi:hypothetical protein
VGLPTGFFTVKRLDRLDGSSQSSYCCSGYSLFGGPGSMTAEEIAGA